jgi:hypothetical protein
MLSLTLTLIIMFFLFVLTIIAISCALIVNRLDNLNTRLDYINGNLERMTKRDDF